MSDELTELERRRLEASTDNCKHTPEDVLRFALDDLKNDGVGYNAVFIILIKKNPDTNVGETSRYRAGLRIREEIGYLQLAQSWAIEDWKR